MTPHGAAGSAVAALLRSGKISESEARDAERWYRDYALGVHGVFDAEFSGAGGGDAHTAGFARAKAARAYSQACVAVGSLLTRVLMLVIIDGATMRKAGEAVGFDKNEIGPVCIVALRRLSEHYASIDQTITGPLSGKIRFAEISA